MKLKPDFIEVLAAVVVIMAAVQPASATVIQTSGSGSAVTTVEASADFESQAALFDNPYIEGGMSFSRTNLTFDNNGCGFAGFAGCVGHIGFPGFVSSGNYMYGVGSGFFTISTLGTAAFTGLEFVTGTGFSQTSQNISWEAYLDSNPVGSGFTTALAAGDVIGFSDPSGFDELH